MEPETHSPLIYSPAAVLNLFNNSIAVSQSKKLIPLKGVFLQGKGGNYNGFYYDTLRDEASESIETYQAEAPGQGYHPHFIQHISSVAQDCRDGVFAGTNSAVRDITGREPLGMREFIRKHRVYFE
jgi:hypothetical protein